MEERLKKILQKRFYDLLSHKNGILMMIAGVFLLTISAFHFGEALLEWSQDKYEAVFHSFSDNVAEKNFRDRLSTALPIDIVYTWVNGSDPNLIRQLEMVKLSPTANTLNATRKQTKEDRESPCPYTNCVCVGLLLSPPLPDTLTLSELKLLKLAGVDGREGSLLFSNVTDLKVVKEQSDWPANFTQLDLATEHDALQVLSMAGDHWTHGGVNYTISRAFYTSDLSLPHGMMAPSVVMMSGYPSRFTADDIKTSLAARVNDTSKFPIDVKIYEEQGISLLSVPQTSQYNQLIQDTGYSIDGKTVMFNRVKLVWSLHQNVKDDVVAANRFEDNEELRYSLRSVEKNAPWVRHIFIVTNGQIPYWLNLDSPRLTVITHDEIFHNASHLPSFSSPAIEANIHKIPGLSEKFIYMNDDVMFGNPVWPDDFYSHSSGHKVYLTWPVPNCNEGCPSTWIKDGYCDKACNSSECEWDGGDCLGGNSGAVQFGVGYHNNLASDTSAYCATGCADTWLADKYCDQACNNLECGFDTGDCGTDNYYQLHGFDLTGGKQQHYSAPQGENLMYFNLTELLGTEGKVTGAKVVTNAALRVATVANKFKVMTIVLHPDRNSTTLDLRLDYSTGVNTSFTLNVSVDVDTSVKRKEVIAPTQKVEQKNETFHSESEDTLDAKAFTGWPEHQKDPTNKVKVSHKSPRAAAEDDLVDLLFKHFKDVQDLSEPLKQQLEDIELAYQADELTVEGLKFKLSEMASKFRDEMESYRPQLERLKLSVPAGDGQGQEQQQAQHELGGMNQPQQKPQEQQQKSQDERQHQWQDQQRQQQLLQDQDMQKSRPDDQAREGEEKEEKKETQPEKHEKRLQQPSEEDQQLLVRKKLQHKSRQKIVKQGQAANNDGREEGKAAASPSKLKSAQAGGNKKSGAKKPHQGNEDHEQGQNSEMRMRIDGENDDGESPYDVGDQGAGGRKLLSSFFNRLIERGEDQQHSARTKMRQEKQMMSEEDFLRLVRVGETQTEGGSLPWERNQKFAKDPGDDVAVEYIVEGWQGRQLLDTFGDSLRHVNSLYNKEFGFASRKVPAHMPHFIDKSIMKELQERFPEQWEATSSHRIRDSKDMQYSFSYFYYLMGVTESVPVEKVFDDMDTDLSGVLSDREIRTLATRLYDLPLYLETLTGLESAFKNCSHSIDENAGETILESSMEVYYDKEMPQVTRKLFTSCKELTDLVREKFKPQPKYKTVEMDDSDIAFKMIHTNVSHVVGQLDDVRKHTKKFICLNDNIEHSKNEAKTVKAVLQDFYESMFPKASQFELQREYRNRFLHMDDLREWRTYRDRLRLFTHIALSLLIILTVASFFGDKIESWRNRLALRRSQNYQSSSPAMSSSLLSGSSSLLPQQDKDSDGRDTPPSSISTLGSTHQPEADSCVMWPGQGPIDTV